MKTFDPVLVSVLAASLFMASQLAQGQEVRQVERSMAENWSAVGLLTTEVLDQPAKVEFISIDNFGSKGECDGFLEVQSQSTDYIGKGGTNQQVPPVQWNFDGLCIKKRTFEYYSLNSLPYGPLQ